MERWGLGEKNLLLIMIVGLLLSCISIMMSVDYLYREHQYVQLGITAMLFAFMVMLIRHLKLKYESLNKIEKNRLMGIEQ